MLCMLLHVSKRLERWPIIDKPRMPLLSSLYLVAQRLD